MSDVEEGEIEGELNEGERAVFCMQMKGDTPAVACARLTIKLVPRCSYSAPAASRTTSH
jgi:hypothetical protein